MTNKDIILKPKFAYWIEKCIPGIILVVLMVIFLPFIEKYLGNYAKYVILALCLFVLIVMTWNYIKWIYCTKWVIGERKIAIHRGVINKVVDHTELFRILDIKETRNVLDLMFGVETIHLYSQDLTDPDLRIFGVKVSKEVVEEINDRVQNQRRLNKVLEITNQ